VCYKLNKTAPEKQNIETVHGKNTPSQLCLRMVSRIHREMWDLGDDPMSKKLSANKNWKQL
jgi:hypothetical protein